MFLRAFAILAAMVMMPSISFAERDNTKEALLRLEESLALQIEEGLLAEKELLPIMIVSVTPAFVETATWYPNEALDTLTRVFSKSGLRFCAACRVVRTYVESGRVEQNSTQLDVLEIIRLDETNRGKAIPARTALWLDETKFGVALRLVDLQNSRIVVAENFDAAMREQENTEKTYFKVQELERRRRGESLTHTFFDLALYPGHHVSIDWLEQWGDTNANLTGLSLSLYDPVVGAGVAYYRVIPEAWNIMIGGQAMVSLLSVMIRSFGADTSDFLDPPLTGVAFLRIPLVRSNYGILVAASTNGEVGIGLSLLNTSVLPFLP